MTMLSYDLKVGYSCNNRCIHCVIEDSRDMLIRQKKQIDLTTNECKALIDEGITKGADNIVLTGGEVTIRPDFPDLLDYATAKGASVTIQSNGRGLKNSSVADAVCSYPHIDCVIAIHGASSEIHDTITTVNGSFSETLHGLRLLSRHGVPTTLKTVISKINMTDLTNIANLALQTSIPDLCFAFPHGQGGARKNWQKVIPTYTELLPHLNTLIEFSNQHNLRIQFEAIPLCVIPHSIHMAGELKYLFGDVACRQVGEALFLWSGVRTQAKAKATVCSACSLDKLCEGVWREYADCFGTDELHPIKISDNLKTRLFDGITVVPAKNSRTFDNSID